MAGVHTGVIRQVPIPNNPNEIQWVQLWRCQEALFNESNRINNLAILGPNGVREFPQWLNDDPLSREAFRGDLDEFVQRRQAWEQRWNDFNEWLNAPPADDHMFLRIQGFGDFEFVFQPPWQPHNGYDLSTLIDDLLVMSTQWNTQFAQGIQQSPPFLVFAGEANEMILGQFAVALSLIVNGGRGRGGRVPNIRHSHAPGDAVHNIIFEPQDQGHRMLRFLGTTNFHIDGNNLQNPAMAARHDQVNARAELENNEFAQYVLVRAPGGADQFVQQ